MKVHSPHLGALHPPVQPLHASAGVKRYLTGLLRKSLATPDLCYHRPLMLAALSSDIIISSHFVIVACLVMLNASLSLPLDL